MTSPFERVSSGIAIQIRSLRLPAQIGLFAAGAKALSGVHLMWAQAMLREPYGDLLEHVIEEAMRFAQGELRNVDGSLLPAIERAAPAEPSDSRHFTGAQDCWILADTAIRAAQQEFEPADSAWYLLEPIFQATSERLFSLTDPGSDKQEEMESIALKDPALVAAIGAVTSAVDILRNGPISRTILDQLSVALEVLVPQ